MCSLTENSAPYRRAWCHECVRGHQLRHCPATAARVWQEVRGGRKRGDLPQVGLGATSWFLVWALVSEVVWKPCWEGVRQEASVWPCDGSSWSHKSGKAIIRSLSNHLPPLNTHCHQLYLLMSPSIIDYFSLDWKVSVYRESKLFKESSACTSSNMSQWGTVGPSSS